MAKARLSAASAGYMELGGAQKDADCSEVEVKGGVASVRGCCNEFKPPNPNVDGFRCGTCKYVVAAEKPDSFYGQS